MVAKRRAGGTALRFAVPPAVLELLTQEAGDHAIHILIKAGAQGDNSAIDARLDLAAEERLPRVLPMAAVSRQRHRPTHRLSVRVDAEIMKQLERRQGGGPGLVPVLIALREVTRREACAPSPLAIFALQRQQPGTPALRGHPRALRGHGFNRCMNKVAQHLPADGRVRIEQPVQYSHNW